MNSSFQPVIILCLLGVVQALLLALVLLTIRRGNLTANRLLAAVAITISIEVGAIILNSTGSLLIYPHLARINHPLDFLGGPLIFLYARALITKAKLTRKDLLHFVPAVLVALFLVPYYLQSREHKIAALSSSNWYYTRAPLAITQFLVYLVLIVIMVMRYSRSLKKQPTSYERAVLVQIRFLVIYLLGLWLLAIARYAFDLRFPYYLNRTLLILPLGLTIFVYVLAYLGLRNPEVLTGDKEPQAAKKYEKSTLTPDRAEKYLQRLRHAMEPEKLYTDGDLTLQKLATKLSIPVQHLSQVVNEHLQQNILDFINAHRVEEAKRRLLDPEKKHLSILAIAEDVGFNSKSSFNAVFKKYTNLTPSEFRKTGEEKINSDGHRGNAAGKR
jgi:AraC-like DNA-binding protein